MEIKKKKLKAKKIKYIKEKEENIEDNILGENDLLKEALNVENLVFSEELKKKETVLRSIDRCKDYLLKILVGQSHAVKTIISKIKRNLVMEASFSQPNKPFASFLICGPTGTGKTEMVRLLALYFFGSKRNMIKLDMSEFMESHSISKLIGTPPGYVGYPQGGQLTNAIAAKPGSIVLFDEIEKAHFRIFDILLQLLDDGIITDARGKNYSFKNCLIIFTSNIGSKQIFNYCRRYQKNEFTEMQFSVINFIVHKQIERYFRPELLNRLTQIIIFRPLSKKDSKLIFDRLFLNSKTLLEKQYVCRIFLTNEAELLIFNRGYNLLYGVRSLQRAISLEFEEKFIEFCSDMSETAGYNFNVEVIYVPIIEEKKNAIESKDNILVANNNISSKDVKESLDILKKDDRKYKQELYFSISTKKD